MPEQEVQYQALVWLVIPNRGDMAVIDVEEPGIALGEPVSIDEQEYQIRGIESHCLTETKRYFGKRVGVLVEARKS